MNSYKHNKYNKKGTKENYLWLIELLAAKKLLKYIFIKSTIYRVILQYFSPIIKKDVTFRCKTPKIGSF